MRYQRLPLSSVLASLSTIAACGSALPRGTGPSATVEALAPQVLPAGAYWYTYSACDDACRVPKVATILRFTTPEVARPAVALLEGKLPPGYPVILHQDQLTIAAKPGLDVIVVLGFHVDAAKADAYLVDLGALAGKATIEPILDGFPPADKPDATGVHLVSRIDRGTYGANLPAYHRADVVGPDGQAIDPARIGKAPSACRVRLGDFFIVERADVLWYRWAPVRCDGQVAYIPWRSSLLGGATVLPGPDGPRLRQVTNVACDAAGFTTWKYTLKGRAAVIADDPAPVCDNPAP
jgi:hypothetical protein